MATYYIKNGGNNALNGLSVANAWETLYYACTHATTPGDVIHVVAGNYTENTMCSLSVGVSIIGEGDGSVITSAAGITIINAVSATGDAVDGNQSISYLKFDGDLTALRAIRANYRSRVLVHHCTFIDFLYQALWFTGSSSAWNVDPANVIPVGIKVYDNTFTNNTQYTGNSDAGHIVFQGVEDMEIYNNTFDQTDRAAGDNATIINGWQYYNMKIHDNVFTKPDNNAAAWNFFVETHYCHGGLEVYNNTFNGTANYDLSGCEKGVYAFGARIYDNIFTTAALTPLVGHAEPSIALESFDVEEDVYIYRNYFKNTRTCISMGNCANGTDGIHIYNNIMETIGNTDDNWTFGVLINSTYGATPVEANNVYVYNNTINTAVASFGGVGFGVRGNMTNIEIINNIIKGTFARPVYVLLTGGTPTVDQLNINNNIFDDCSSNVISYAGGITFTNLDDSGNIVDDPLFVGGAPYSFKLQAASPAIDAGLDVGLVSDYIGTLVPYGSAPDIGAYEWFLVDYDFAQITLVNTPACHDETDPSIISRWVATEVPILFTLLRRDWYIISTADNGGFVRINILGTFGGNDDDTIALYDETTESMYTGTITDSSAAPIIDTDIPYVAGMEFRYMNDHTLYPNYYFEGRLTINDVVETLTVTSSPDRFGLADLDVAGILRIHTAIGKVTNYLSLIQKDYNKSGKFTFEYRGCWFGSDEEWIQEGLNVSPNVPVEWYYVEAVRSEEQGCNMAEYVPSDKNEAPFLNQFDQPVYFYGLPFDLSFIMPQINDVTPSSPITVTIKVYDSQHIQLGTDIVQSVAADELEGYVNSLAITPTLIAVAAAYFTIEITADGSL